MTAPNWLAATAGNSALATQVNQFLGTHAVQYVYTGVVLGGSTTLGSGGVNTNGLYIAQAMTPGSNQALGRMVMTVSVTGTPGPLVFSLQSNNAGAPSGTVLASVTIPYNYFPASEAQLSIPLVFSLVSGTTYWLVANAVGDASDYYTFYKTTTASGVSTSTNGTSWTAQTYGLYYARWDQSVVTPLLHTYEDGGARWTAFSSNSNETISTLDEYTVAQGTSQFVYSARTYASTSGSVTSIT